MAIDHRIIQQIGVRDNAPALNMFQNTLSQVQNRGIQQQQADQQAELQPFRQQLLEQQATIGAGQAQDATNQRILKSVNDFAIGNQSIINDAVNTGDPTQLQAALVKRRAQLVAQGLPTETTDEGLVMLGQGDIQGVVSGLSDSVRLFNQQQGRGASAGQREFQNLLTIAQDPNATELERNSAKRALGSMAKVGTSAQERIAQDKTLGQQVVDQKSAEATGTEIGKSKTQLKFKPQITKAVKLAEKEATERGEVLTDLGRMEASLPGVKEVVNELLELSDIATSTLGGKAFDFVVKQSGFGSTKGATAKAKMEAIVDNQVLPLLKETFGAAFTATEGEALKSSLVNPDSSPAQRKAQLEAFLAQKERNVRTKQTQAINTQSTEVGINEFAGFKVIR
tara:strand:- start:1338 stop:2525 length:1188 start_codon:yes stop_codon:yes gene_type:complete